MLQLMERCYPLDIELQIVGIEEALLEEVRDFLQPLLLV